jgi:hypothetical protein
MIQLWRRVVTVSCTRVSVGITPRPTTVFANRTCGQACLWVGLLQHGGRGAEGTRPGPLLAPADSRFESFAQAVAQTTYA